MAEETLQEPASVTMTCGCGNVAQVEPESPWLVSWRCPRCLQRHSILTVEVEQKTKLHSVPSGCPSIRMRSTQGFIARHHIDKDYQGNGDQTTGAE